MGRARSKPFDPKIFVERFTELCSSSLVTNDFNGFRSVIGLGYGESGGIQFSNPKTTFNDLEWKELARLVRFFYHSNEPTALNKCTGYIKTNGREAELAELGAFEKRQMEAQTSQLITEADSVVLKPTGGPTYNELIGLFLNAYLYHSDQAKRDSLEKQAAVLPSFQNVQQQEFWNAIRRYVSVIKRYGTTVREIYES